VLCICDCEGYEAEIFNEGSILGVANWDLLIELHGEAGGRVRGLAWPHAVTEIRSTVRTEGRKELEGLGDQKRLLSEYRGGPQTWLWCDSRA
jgi:hypothetical protein